MDCGAFIVCGDYEGDVSEIAEALNSLDFSDGQFAENKDGRVMFFPDDYIMGPTVFTHMGVVTFNDGRRIEEVFQEEFESDEPYTFNYEEYSLEAICRKIAPTLRAGSLELIAFGNLGYDHGYYERLTVHSNGSAERHKISADSKTGTESQSQNFGSAPKRGRNGASSQHK